MPSLASRIIGPFLFLTLMGPAATPAFAQSRNAVLQQLSQVEQRFREGRYPQVIATGSALVGPLRQALGENRDYSALLNILSAAYSITGDNGKAEAMLNQSLAVFQRISGPQSTDVATCLNNLGELSKRTGRLDAAIDYFRKSLAIHEARSGANSTAVATVLNSIAGAYIDFGRGSDAEPVLRRAIDIWNRMPRPNPVDASRPLTNLATIYALSGRQNEAEPLYRQAIALKQRALGQGHPDLIAPLNGLGDILATTGRTGEAVQVLKYSLAINEGVFGAGHPSAIPVLTTLGSAYSSSGNTTDADATFQRLLTQQRNMFGSDHASIALTLGNLAAVRGNAGKLNESLNYARDAVRVASLGIRDGKSQTAFKSKVFFETHLRILDQARKQLLPEADAADEAFQTAQWINESTAAGALNQLSARFSAGNDGLARLVRAHQDVQSEYRKTDAALSASISAIGLRNPTQDMALRNQLAAQAADVERLAKRLQTEFPAYASLASGSPLPANDVRKLLGADEALLYFYAAETMLHVFVLTSSDIKWTTVPIGQRELTDRIKAFRHGLDFDAADRSVRAGKPDLFDLTGAHAMYKLLLPSDQSVADKNHWIVVPTGALTALPFNLLVTARANTTGATAKPLSPYRTASWLGRQKAISILPSVSSLRTVRITAAKARAAKPMIGFGDPIFGGSDDSRVASSQRSVAKRTLGASFTEFWKGAGVDRAKLSDALPRLADTADELKTIAAKLNAPDAVQLGASATETFLKSAPLADYRIIYFATHSLVAGDVNGIAEPSLALTIPANPTSLDDGLLTSSEVAALSLNADWVVLSACNTVSGDTPGAEALSGLARAFFYAGARSLLITHWAVLSSAATTLTTSTFTALQQNPKLGRAEALKRAMTAMIDDPSDDWNAYPAVWAPFEIVGANTDP